jgi:hypothetical protein
MLKKILLYFVFILPFFISAQNTITIKGKVVDSTTNSGLESATVYVKTVKDSSVVDYTISSSNGDFQMKLKKSDLPHILKISYNGFSEFSKNIENLNEDIDFGTLSMKEIIGSLNEVTVAAEIPPITIKSDTLEFNAASFKVRPDANVETLLKQLPGVEIDTEGKITVNGKEVNQILVNGKPFFDKDGKIALQNLPAELINKVQVTDTKTKTEELSGQNASGNNSSINLTIDEEKNKGLFGKFLAGKGSDDRYESSALVNYFKGDRKISLLASSNNINASGFTMNEVFDSMGGGRNMSFYTSGDGSFGIGNMYFGSGRGITRSDIIGVNYADQWFENFDTNLSYFYASSNTRNTNRTLQENFLPDGNFKTASESDSRNERVGHNVNFSLEYKINESLSIYAQPKFESSFTKNKSNGFENSSDENDDLLNESTRNSISETNTNTFENEISINKTFKKKGRFINLNFENENTKTNSDAINQSETFFIQTADPDDIRDQKISNENSRTKYKMGFEYSEPLKDSLSLRFGIEYENLKSIEDRQTNDFDDFSDSYSNQNDFLTSFFTSKTRSFKPTAGFSINKKKFNFSLKAGTTLTNFSNEALYLGNTAQLDKNYVLPNANVYLNYKISKASSIWMNYYYNVGFPTASQVLPIENLANPLNTFIGNPNLDPSQYHSVYGSFRNYDFQSKSGYSFYVGGNLYDNQIVSTTFFDADRKRTTTYENISGIYNFFGGGNLNKTFKKEANTYKIGFGIRANYGLSKGFTNGEPFEARNTTLVPRTNFTYQYGELLTIEPSYSFTYNKTNYENYIIDKADNFLHTLKLQTTSYWPKNWVFGNDFGYNYNSNIADGFKKDFYLWNTSLSYGFYNKQLLAKVKVYDMLNQNQNTTRTITATTIRDEENTVLKRYVMFSLTYKIDKFAGKDKPGSSSFIMF